MADTSSCTFTSQPKNKSTNSRSFEHARYSTQYTAPSQSHDKPPALTVAPFTTPSGHPKSGLTAVATSDDQLSSPSAPTQTPIGQAPRHIAPRKPYSEALLGANAKQPDTATVTHPSSSLATQIEPSSSSVNGDQPVRKCGVTDKAPNSTPSSARHGEAGDGISLYIANLPCIQSTMSLDRLRADLYAHLSSLAKIDRLTVRLGLYDHRHPSQGRQVLAFAFTSSYDEARKIVGIPLPCFMGRHLRVEVNLTQRTLYFRASEEHISLEPLRKVLPWASTTRQQCPLLHQERTASEPPLLTRILVRELCSAFGPVDCRERAPYEVVKAVFVDYEACQRAKQTFAELATETGIAAVPPSKHTQATPLPSAVSESDVAEFSSDCLPITTTSSSSLLEVTEQDGESAVTTAFNKVQIDGGALVSPATEDPPTPTLSSTIEVAESEVYEPNLPRLNRQSRGVLPITASKVNEARRDQMKHQHREIDPFGIFVSHLPEVDDLQARLQGHFSQDGPIKLIRVLSTRNNNPSLFAFVTFAERASVQRALSRHNHILKGKALNVRPKEVGQHSPRRHYGPKTSVTVNVGVAAFNETSIRGQAAEGGAGAVPPVMIRFGSGPASPQVALGQAKPCFLPSPVKQRGASLPSRPVQWSPTREAWTSTSVRSSPSNLANAFEVASTDSTAHRSLQHHPSGASDVYGPVIVPPMMPTQWPCAPPSPMSVSTQPTTAVHSPSTPSNSFKVPLGQCNYEHSIHNGTPTKNTDNRGDVWMPAQGGMMMAAPPMLQDCGSWPVLHASPSGQRLVTHPEGGQCSWIAFGPMAAHHIPMQLARQHQQQPGVTGQDEHSQGGPHWQVDPSLSGKGEEREEMTGLPTSHLMGPPLGVPPQFFSSVPPGSPSMWTMQPSTFGPPFGNGMNREGSKQGQRGTYYPGHGYNANLGPIQIPAWMNDSC